MWQPSRSVLTYEDRAIHPKSVALWLRDRVFMRLVQLANTYGVDNLLSITIKVYLFYSSNEFTFNRMGFTSVRIAHQLANHMASPTNDNWIVRNRTQQLRRTGHERNSYIIFMISGSMFGIWIFFAYHCLAMIGYCFHDIVIMQCFCAVHSSSNRMHFNRALCIVVVTRGFFCCSIILDHLLSSENVIICFALPFAHSSRLVTFDCTNIFSSCRRDCSGLVGVSYYCTIIIFVVLPCNFLKASSERLKLDCKCFS